MLLTQPINHETNKLPLALGLTKERVQEISAKLYEKIEEKNPSKNSHMIEIILETCETIEEAAHFIFKLGQEDICSSCPMAELHGHGDAKEE